MKRIVSIIILFLFLTAISLATVSAEISMGPAPNSGDGISDGSGLTAPNYQNGEPPGMGSAPNSGDGVSDGSGF